MPMTLRQLQKIWVWQWKSYGHDNYGGEIWGVPLPSVLLMNLFCSMVNSGLLFYLPLQSAHSFQWIRWSPYCQSVIHGLLKPGRTTGSEQQVSEQNRNHLLLHQWKNCLPWNHPWCQKPLPYCMYQGFYWGLFISYKDSPSTMIVPPKLEQLAAIYIYIYGTYN